MPASAHARLLAATYTFDAGSSPTRTVAKPGAWPRSVRRRAASATSLRISAAIALPSMILAVMGCPTKRTSEHPARAGADLTSGRAPSVAEVATAGECHRDPMLFGGCDHFGVPHGASGLDHRCRSRARDGVHSIPEREECIG